MAARCPHYARPCHDPDSVHCFYVKNTTHTAFVNLQQLHQIAGRLERPDARTKVEIETLQDFLDSTRR
jgi:hypothetical protein